MEQFKVFRAIGLGFKAWFANFIPITLLAAVLYAPVVIRLAQASPTQPEAWVHAMLDHFAVVVVAILAVYQLFIGIVQAVSYSLLRADKDGVPNDELAKVFE